MIQWTCHFCGEELLFKTCRHKGAHITNCKSNPKRQETIDKLKVVNLVERIELTKNCEKCGEVFTQIRTAAEIKRGGHWIIRFCSPRCSHQRVLSPEGRKNISETLKKGFADGSIIHANPRSREERTCTVCGAIFSCVHSSTKKACGKKCGNTLISRALKGTGKVGGYKVKSGTSKFHGSYYNDIWMDSSWERRLAERLDTQQIKWERDLTFFFKYLDIEGRERKYYPDFYLPDSDLYIECKGYWTDKVRFKMESVQKTNKFNLLILDSIDKIVNFDI